MTIIPKCVYHKPVFEELCTSLPIEPAGTPNTESADGSLTDTREKKWIENTGYIYGWKKKIRVFRIGKKLFSLLHTLGDVRPCL